MNDVVVIGGGAAGCMAALAAAEKGASVTLLERNPKLGRKLYITGKGRCNVTNDCTPQEVLRNIPQNSRFLTSAITRFPPEQVKEFFQRQGVPLKTERGNRVFPQSDRDVDGNDGNAGTCGQHGRSGLGISEIPVLMPGSLREHQQQLAIFQILHGGFDSADVRLAPLHPENAAVL